MSERDENSVTRSPRPLNLSELSREELIRIFKNVSRIDGTLYKLLKEFDQGLKEYKKKRLIEDFKSELAKPERQEKIKELSNRKYKNPTKELPEKNSLSVRGYINKAKNFVIRTALYLMLAWVYIVLYVALVMGGINKYLFGFEQEYVSNAKEGTIIVIELILGILLGIFIIVYWIRSDQKGEAKTRVSNYRSNLRQDIERTHAGQYEREFHRANPVLFANINECMNFPDYADWGATSLDDELKSPHAIQFYISRLENFEASNFSSLVYLYRESMHQEQMRNLQLQQLQEQREAHERLRHQMEIQHQDRMAQGEKFAKKANEQLEGMKYNLEDMQYNLDRLNDKFR